MGIIYCYTNLINNKKYIGQTINPKQRFKQHKSSAFNERDKDYNSPLHRAFRKYGYDNFKYEVLAEAETIEELNGLEIYYIAHFNSKNNGYNIESGGKNSSKPKSEETKKKLMKSHSVLTEEEIIFLRKAYQNNESPSKIYKELYENNMHYNSFLNIWTGSRYSFIMPEVFQNKKHTKLNYELAQAIRNEYKNSKTSYDKLAKKYNVSKSTVSDVIKERTWKPKNEPVSTIP